MASIKNYLLAFLALSTVGSLAFAWRQNLKLAEMQAGFDRTLSEKDAAWEKRLAALQRHNLEVEGQLTAAKSEVEAEAPSASSEGAPPPRDLAARGPGGRAAQFMALMEDPEFSRLWMTEQRAQLDNRYAALFRNLKLSPAELEKFKNLLVEKQNSFRDVLAAARAQGVDPRSNREEFRALIAQTRTEIDGTIQSTLGAAAYNQYKQYEQTFPVRNLVDQLDQRLSYSNTPLNNTQAEQLVQVLAQTQPTSGNSTTALRNNGRVNLTDTAVAQAASVLTPDQQAALSQLQAEQKAQRKVQEMLRQNRQSGGQTAGGSGATPPPQTPRPPAG